MFAIFNLCIFTSAFLLFLIQPMVANILLPHTGGSPNVWNTCSVFFQVSLLIGYLYSYLVSQKISLKHQILLHCSLLFCALWIINFRFQNIDINMTKPVTDTLTVLLKNIFFPFVLLSTTSPLIQHWLASSKLKERKNPYSLYVFSNIGSLLALYAYPLVFEKQMKLSNQGVLWQVIFGLFFCCVIIVSIYLNKTVQQPKIKHQSQSSKINPISVFYWIFFAFIPSSLMLGVTNHLSTDIGGMPFLWIFPLSLYLLSFILTFSRFYTKELAVQFQKLYKVSAVIAVFLFYNTSIDSNIHDNLILIGEHCLFYFVFATYCHGVLASKKPNPESLTLFYLCLAIGGALGGIFNTFIAPHLFLSITEYPFIIALSLPFVLGNLSETRKDLSAIFKKLIILFVIIILAHKNFLMEYKYTLAFPFFYIGLVLLLLFIFFKKHDFLFLCLLTCVFSQLFIYHGTDIIFKKRNFFGSLIIQKIPSPQQSTLALYHGDTLHGRQFVSETNGKEIYNYDPSSYYGKGAAVGDLFKVFKKTEPSVAWLGLGSGAIICYTAPETKHHIFEIDKDIVDISKKYRYFRYLEHCAPKAKISIGDARTEISKEENNKYDLIVIDVFSSHFIPVHLTTQEAVEIYRSKLKSDGLILVHISSRAFDIEPVLTKIAETLGMNFIVRFNPAFDKKYPQWGVLTNSDNLPEIKKLLSMEGWRNGKMKESTPLWTDDFHNLVSALRR